MGNLTSDISGFYIVGINYKKTDADVRGQFAISNEHYERLLKLAPKFHLTEFFILSTCNRTEIIGFADDPSRLADLLCTQTSGNRADFQRLSYTKKGLAAIEHLFQVGAGLEGLLVPGQPVAGFDRGLLPSGD